MEAAVNTARIHSQEHFTLAGGRERASLLPSPLGRGVGGEGPEARNLPASGPMVVLPSPQTPLPRGEGLYPGQREMVLPSLQAHSTLQFRVGIEGSDANINARRGRWSAQMEHAQCLRATDGSVRPT